MPWREPPRVNFEEQAEYRWPFWKLGLNEDDLFGDLHQRFNTAPMFIQDPQAFHHDVNEIARQALNKEDFYSRLQKRRDQRLDELTDMQDKIGALHSSGYNRLADNQRFHRIRLEAYASLDCLVAFCASFLTPNEKGMMPSLDIFMQSEDLYKRNKLFKGLEASLKPSTPDSHDLEHAELPPSPPEGDGEGAPSTTLDANFSSASRESCAPETPINRKRKHQVDSDVDDSPQVKRPRPGSIDNTEQGEEDIPSSSQGTNRKDSDPESSFRRNKTSTEDTAYQNPTIPPSPDYQPCPSPIDATRQSSGRHSPRSRSRLETTVGRRIRTRRAGSAPSSIENFTKQYDIGENSVSPQRKSGRTAARSATKGRHPRTAEPPNH